jgi:hypothetical protein
MAASEERRFQALVLAPVRRVQRRLNAVAWAEAGLVPVWTTVTACVLARMLLRGAVVWALPPLVAAGLAWWFLRARSRGVSLEHAAVLADRSANAGGLLLTRLERPVGEWELALNQLAGQVKLPEVKWRRPAAALLGACVFLVVGFLLPLPTLKTRPLNAAAAAKVAAVQAQAEALAKEEVLDEAVEDELRRLAQEVAEGRFDSGDWEATDALEKRLAEQASEAAAELANAAEAARELEDALGAAGSAEAATREREALERALMDLGAGDSSAPEEGESPGAQGDTGTQGQQADAKDPSEQGQSQQAQGQQGQQGQQAQQGQQGQQGQQSANAQSRARAQASGSPDQIADLRQTLERRRQSLEQRFQQREGNGSQSQQARRQSQRRNGSGQGRNGSGQQGSGSEQNGSQGGNNAGHASRNVREGAGAGRGGDNQELVFGGEAEMDPERLAFEPLPTGQGGEAPQDLWGLKAADPKRQAGPAGAGSAQGTQAQGDATAGPGAAPLLPRNRDLVKRYFGGE